MTDFKDEIRERASGGGLERYIEQVGILNNKTDTSLSQTVYDFFLGDDDTSVFERYNNGRFGGTAVVQDGEVKKATIRVGAAEVPKDGDVFLTQVRLEELVEEQNPPGGIEVDMGDFDQGIPHLRFGAEATGIGTYGPGPSVEEFGRFMVDAVEAIRENEQALKEIARGERFEL